DAREAGVNDRADAGDASTRPVTRPAASVSSRRTILRRDMIESSNQHDDGTMVAGRTPATDRRQRDSSVGHLRRRMQAFAKGAHAKPYPLSASARFMRA